MIARLLACLLALSLLSIATPVVAPAGSQETEGSHTSANFEITWETDPSSRDTPDVADGDGDGVPDTIERVLDTFERARSFLIDLGYRPPPNEDLYPLVVAEGSGFGYTQPLFLTEGQSQPSFILVPVRLVRTSTDQGQLDIFAVHEFHHAIQLGYDANDAHWIREATSTWLEDVWRDDLERNHLWVRAFVPRPELPLTYVNGAHEYGAFLFLQYLSERFDGGGTTLVRELWDELAVPGVDSIQAIRLVLARRDTSLPAAWGEFLLWRFRLEHFSEGSGYLAALSDTGWPTAEPDEPVAADSCRRTLAPMPPLAARYIKIKPARKAPAFGLAQLRVSGPPGSAGMAEIKLRGLPPGERILVFDDSGVARLDVSFGRKQARRIILGLSRTAAPPPGPRVVRPLAWSLSFEGRRSTAVSPISAPERVSVFNSASLRGSVSCGGVPEAGAEVLVVGTRADGQQQEYEAVTGADGSWFVAADPDATTTYVAIVDDPLLGEASTSPVKVEVALEVSLVITDPHVPLGTPFELTGQTFPAHDGSHVRVQFRRPERPWRDGVTVTTGPGGEYSADLLLPRSGVWETRVAVDPGDEDHLPNNSVVRWIVVERD